MIESVFWYSTVRAFELVSAGNEDKTPKGKSVTKEFWNSEISLGRKYGIWTSTSGRKGKGVCLRAIDT